MWLRLALPLGVFLLLVGLLYAGLERDPSVVPSPLIGKPAPAFALPALHEPGRTVSSDDLAGRAYLLNVWASWCPPCRDEHPVINGLAESGAIPVYGLNYKDRREDALRWLRRYGDSYADILHDPEGRLGLDLGVYKVPETFIIGPDGVIRYKHIGPLTDETVQREILPLVARLKRESS